MKWETLEHGTSPVVPDSRFRRRLSETRADVFWERRCCGSQHGSGSASLQSSWGYV